MQEPDLVVELAEALKGLMPLAEVEVSELFELGADDSTYQMQARFAAQRIAAAKNALRAVEAARNGASHRDDVGLLASAS